jgi:hypothetical protein
MQKIVLTFGLIAGAILSSMMLLAMLFQDQIGFERGATVGYTSMVLAFLMTFFGIRTYRDNVAGGQLSFGRAFKVGLLITLVASVCYVATWELIYYKLSPDFSDRYAAHAVEQARRAGKPEAEIATIQADMAKFKELYRNPFINVAITLLEPLPVGLVFSLVAAWALSRKRKGVGQLATAG